MGAQQLIRICGPFELSIQIIYLQYVEPDKFVRQADNR